MKAVSETSGTTLNTSTFELQGSQGRREKEGPEKIFEEIIAKKFPNMGKEIITQVQEVQGVPYRINPRINMLRHIVIKLTKIKCKDKTLKATREKQQITYKGIPIRLSADFSAETLQARRECHNLFKVMKGKKYNQEYSTQQGSHSDSTEKSKASQTSKS